MMERRTYLLSDDLTINVSAGGMLKITSATYDTDVLICRDELAPLCEFLQQHLDRLLVEEANGALGDLK